MRFSLVLLLLVGCGPTNAHPTPPVKIVPPKVNPPEAKRPYKFGDMNPHPERPLRRVHVEDWMH